MALTKTCHHCKDSKDVLKRHWKDVLTIATKDTEYEISYEVIRFDIKGGTRVFVGEDDLDSKCIKQIIREEPVEPQPTEMPKMR